jgi:hypothetical protein
MNSNDLVINEAIESLNSKRELMVSLMNSGKVIEGRAVAVEVNNIKAFLEGYGITL